MAIKMKLVFALLVVFLVSTDAKFPNLGKLFGKLSYKKTDIPSIAEKIISKIPFLKPGTGSSKSYADPSAKKSPPSFCGSHDCPEFYEMKLNVTDYTLRCYPKPYLWVSTSVTDQASRQAGRTAFWRLFKYIQGENEEKMKIKMTVPVTNQIQPDEESESFCKNNFTMSFFIPFKHQKDAPAPSADNVYLTVVKPFCAYVRNYGGYSNMGKVEQHYNALVKALERDGLADDFRTDMIYSAGYNGPREFFNRHNEIWLVSKKQTPVQLENGNVPVKKEEKSPNLDTFFGKLPDISSITEKIISKLPSVLKSAAGAESRKSYADPSAKKSLPSFCDSYDCPEFYEMKLNVTDYTLRCYPEPYRWVSTSVTDQASRQAGRTAFWRLFKYIQGENEEKMKIKMTVPVTNQIQPDEESESFCKNNFTMSFFIPFKHQKDAPAPSADNVYLTVVKPFCAYVRNYGGYSNMGKVEQHYNALVKALERDGLADDFRTDMIYSAGYNGPREFFNRHNEIWLVSKKQTPVQLENGNVPVKKEEKSPNLDTFFGKLPDISSITEKIISKLPSVLKSAAGAESRKSYADPSAKKSLPSFCDSYDCPEFYEMKLNVTDYTLRCYPEPYRWVSTSVTDQASRQAGRTAFWRLFKYIQGENEEKMKIKMTVPVTNQIQPDEESESFCKNNFTMSFFIPFKHQKDAPAPSADNVYLTVVKPFCAYVRNYGGYSNMGKVEQHHNALVKALERDGLADDFRTDMIYSAGYDDPMKFLDRHNEIWLVSKNQRPAQLKHKNFPEVSKLETL